uniref:EPS8 signaling adaptor L3b n=1 Tax=Sander lucioperca TaxID=283035 RepID=A0A8C9XBA3_SANLU
RMFGNNGPFSYSPRSGAPLQRNNMSRPSGKSIYMQRKEYSEALNKHPDNFHVRVEHLFTCELDGQEVKTLDDCLAKLKRLDAKSSLWPQEMIMEIQGGYLLLSDIETKAELESLPLSCILQTKAVLDSCAYNSLLTVTVQQRNKRIPEVFMFQCEETGVSHISPEPSVTSSLSNLENIIGQNVPGSFRQAGPRPVQQERTPPPPDHPAPQQYQHLYFLNFFHRYCLSILQTCLPLCSPPMLTEAALRLLSQVVNPEEDQLWRSLGDCWNFPRSRWPDDDVPLYIPEFYDGWQPPAPSHTPSPLPNRSGPMRRSERLPPSPHQSSLYMRVIYDFVARNNRELSIMKGDVVQVVQKSKQWWLVRNARNEEGNVPQNVLEQMESNGPMEDLQREPRGPVTLDMSSPPAEVKAWLEYKGFSKITVTSLGVLNGKLLLGMTKDEIRTVCPEEGGKVFFQLQAIKSAIALASEPSGLYNGRY